MKKYVGVRPGQAVVLTLVLVGVLAASQSVFALGFTAGNEFSAQEIRGRLQVQCMTNTPGPTVGYATCHSEILNPAEYSYFRGPKDVDADQVVLQATRENGSVSVEKTEPYDAAKGQSTKSFNLWIETVFQRPLLGPGKNTVHYVLKKSGQRVSEGSFIANVTDGGRAECRRDGFYTSTSGNDCISAQNFCSRYFSENNYCQ